MLARLVPTTLRGQPGLWTESRFTLHVDKTAVGLLYVEDALNARSPPRLPCWKVMDSLAKSSSGAGDQQANKQAIVVLFATVLEF
jgi:hypothetical protein